MPRLLLLPTLCLLALSPAVHADPPAGRPAASPTAAAERPVDDVLALIDARLKLAPDVARAKWNSGGAIEDAAREAAIIAGLGRQAGQLGLPVDWAESFFRAQIEASKAVQRDLFERWRQQQAGKFADAPDLATTTRPKLDALTPRLLQALAQAWPLLRNPTRGEQIARLASERLRADEYSGAAAAMAGAPLLDAGRP